MCTFRPGTKLSHSECIIVTKLLHSERITVTKLSHSESITVSISTALVKDNQKQRIFSLAWQVSYYTITMAMLYILASPVMSTAMMFMTPQISRNKHRGILRPNLNKIMNICMNIVTSHTCKSVLIILIINTIHKYHKHNKMQHTQNYKVMYCT